MKVAVQSVNFTIEKDLVKYIEKRVNNLERFHDHILGAEIFLKVQSTSAKNNKITELKIKLPGNDIVVKKLANSFEEGVSRSVDSLKRQLVKRKEKLRA
jgi:putative sigma-54 modulation protein